MGLPVLDEMLARFTRCLVVCNARLLAATAELMIGVCFVKKAELISESKLSVEKRCILTTFDRASSVHVHHLNVQHRNHCHKNGYLIIEC